MFPDSILPNTFHVCDGGLFAAVSLGGLLATSGGSSATDISSDSLATIISGSSLATVVYGGSSVMAASSWSSKSEVEQTLRLLILLASELASDTTELARFIKKLAS
ncbi:5102_t:CDS:1, partial [Racocetra fulgida]